MTNPDDILGDELRAAAAEVDGVPPSVVAAARASFTWRTIDAELAALAYDSANDMVGSVRGGEARLLHFDGADVNIDLELDGTSLMGQMTPLGSLELCRPDGVVAVDVDTRGRFAVEDMASGPMSFRCTLADGRVVSTEWVTI